VTSRQTRKTANENSRRGSKIPFYDLKSHGLIDESDILESKGGLYEEDSILDDKTSALDQILDVKKTKLELEKEAEQKLGQYQIIRSLGCGAYA
jgi:hypothetical protein